MKFERKGNEIRFSDTSGISATTWTRILNRFCYLGYDIPDEKFVKKYLDEGIWLNEDQSIEILKILNIEPEKELYPAEQIERHNQQAIEKFGTTNLISLAGYILPDGTLLKMSYTGHMRDMDHREIDEILDVGDDSPTQAMIQFVNYGNIRVSSCGIEISRVPTNKQWSKIGALVQKMRNQDNSYMFVDIANHNGTVVKKFEYEFPYLGSLITDINEYFESLK